MSLKDHRLETKKESVKNQSVRGKDDTRRTGGKLRIWEEKRGDKAPRVKGPSTICRWNISPGVKRGAVRWDVKKKKTSRRGAR